MKRLQALQLLIKQVHSTEKTTNHLPRQTQILFVYLVFSLIRGYLPQHCLEIYWNPPCAWSVFGLAASNRGKSRWTKQ